LAIGARVGGVLGIHPVRHIGKLAMVGGIEAHQTAMLPPFRDRWGTSGPAAEGSNRIGLRRSGALRTRPMVPN